jgi:polyhydroxyalkanoate synthase
MAREGFDFYLLDWGVFGPEDNRLSVEDCVTRILPRVVNKVLETSGSRDVSMVGYCMGAPLSASFIATHPEVRVKNFINMAGPIDFSNIGLFGQWLAPKHFDADKFVDTIGQVPADMVKAGFKLLRPTMDISTGLNLWWNLWNDNYVEGFSALNKWTSEYVPFPAEFFRAWVKDFYQENKLIRGQLTLGGKVVRLGEIRCPVLVVGATDDNIAPTSCVKALMGAVGSIDKEYAEVPGAHVSLIAGRTASTHCWPVVSRWLAPRS